VIFGGGIEYPRLCSGFFSRPRCRNRRSVMPVNFKHTKTVPRSQERLPKNYPNPALKKAAETWSRRNGGNWRGGSAAGSVWGWQWGLRSPGCPTLLNGASGNCATGGPWGRRICAIRRARTTFKNLYVCSVWPSIPTNVRNEVYVQNWCRGDSVGFPINSFPARIVLGGCETFAGNSRGKCWEMQAEQKDGFLYYGRAIRVNGPSFISGQPYGHGDVGARL